MYKYLLKRRKTPSLVTFLIQTPNSTNNIIYLYNIIWFINRNKNYFIIYYNMSIFIFLIIEMIGNIISFKVYFQSNV